VAAKPRKSETENLRYLDASNVECPAGRLAGTELRGLSDQKLGIVDGVLIDPASRQLRYIVVHTSRMFGVRQYLLPVNEPARIDRDRHVLRLDADWTDLAHCDVFEADSVRCYSDEDLMTALFGARRQAEVAQLSRAS
jgi:hypothetical protein